LSSAGSPPLLEVDLRYGVGSLRLEARFSPASERAALFGPSGSGKTTLLRLLAGLARPDAGRIVLDGLTLVDTARQVWVAPGRRGIGLLLQTPALFPHRTVEGNIRFGLHGTPAALQTERVAEMVELLDLGELRSRLPERLSGGEKQRAALARALAPRPRLLLLDEPFSALDAARKMELWEQLQPFLHARNIATMLVSHDPAEVWSTAQTVIRMENGRAVESGPTAQMLAEERAGVLRLLGAQDGARKSDERLQSR
jgi:molybdate transport system ATP-binding protein